MKINQEKFERVFMGSGITLREIARKTQLTSGTISRVRAGRDVRPTTIVRVAMVLGCGIQDLIE